MFPGCTINNNSNIVFQTRGPYQTVQTATYLTLCSLVTYDGQFHFTFKFFYVLKIDEVFQKVKISLCNAL